MSKIKLVAIKRCPSAKPGVEFFASSSEAKALVALGLAKRLTPPAYSQAMPIEPMAPVVPAGGYHLLEKGERVVMPPQNQNPDLLVSKTVEEFAKESGADLYKIVGTGHNGRITRKDVESAIQAV
jgi:pyruvate/2-oxoglutarate dehydrogenase complex dihydrolipoamide acyltransferase (E2) component